VAVGVAAVAVASVIVAIAMREDDTRPAAPPAVVTKVDPPPSKMEPKIEPPVVATAPSTPPKIEGVKASAKTAQLGVELDLDVALTLAAPLQPKEWVTAKATCKLDGEWYSGTGSVRLTKTPAGTSVAPVRISLGRQHAFTAPPTECQLGFEFSSYVQRPSKREWIAKMCWDGTTVTDKPCAASAKTTDGVSVSAVRVQTSAERYRSRTLGGPVDLKVYLDAEIKRPLADWRIEVAADCTLPDGSKHQASDHVYTTDVHAGRPFTSSAWLFWRGQQMLDVPKSCTVAVELADRQGLVREPVSSWCWRDGAVASGACTS
jgi:hypothetical protein